MYPMEKYRYYTNGNKVIAVSTYAGKTVRGVAVCNEGDTFDLEKGKELAAAKCAVKIAQRRVNRAHRKCHEAYNAVCAAKAHMDKMGDYLSDSEMEFDQSIDRLHNLLGKM